ncbi:MAG: Ribosome-recycling factor [candidate division WS6 bacterium OLB20]|uniref:Ribosome-recycling factor n=1 Tax=candidate division WS6 bacterium OLB20 TaxID=1617426 RepID=A0A136LYD3_9BACT|nr:MAG: Ribosome-recycling factor [candidate division WS6 bacterium OLB20]
MSVTLDQAPKKFDEVASFLEKDLASMRAGRAQPQLLDSVRVDVYGQQMPVNQIGNITVVDATLMTVKPWDKNAIEPLMKALKESDMGIQPILDGDTIKLPIPSLTEERRKEYVKLMKAKAEEAHIAVRQVRKDVKDYLDEQKSKNLITEDDLERMEKELQKLVDDANERIATIAGDKEKELMTV